MARLTVPQHFFSVSQIKETFGTTLPKPHEWRLIQQPIVGAIHGLPTTQGVAIATNGIEVVILQYDKIILGHLDFFVADQQQESPVTIKVTNPVKQKQPRERDINEFA